MMTPKEQLIESLRQLCKREGGHAVVATEIDASDQTLYQIISGTKLPSGEPRGVGPTLQKKLNAHYPDWATLPLQAEAPSDQRGRPGVAQALDVLIDALGRLSEHDQKMAADHLQRIALSPDGRKSRDRLLNLLDPGNESLTATDHPLPKAA